MKMGKRGSPFRYREIHSGEPFVREWQVSQRCTKRRLGDLRQVGPANFEVCRPQDDDFHGDFGCRREAARWLRSFRCDPAVFVDVR